MSAEGFLQQDGFQDAVKAVLQDGLGLPDSFLNYMIQYQALNGLSIPITQVTGFKQSISAGLIFMWAGSNTTAPSGYLICDGSAVSRSGQSALFAAIGTTYGVGDGSTTFNLPDLRGRAPFGFSSGGKATVSTLGNNEGLAANLRSPSHHHTYTMPSENAINGNPGPFAGTTGASTSGDTDNVDKPAYLTLNFIIKT